jgi:demethylmenaquinone methyltransferase/2-methoxy-6-polyprenyl-1,4-benzoquinol methylase
LKRTGLDEKDWLDVIDTLEKVVEYYDKMNDIGTFLQAERWRREAARYSNPDLDVLEVGCGPGSFARLLRARRLVCIDPSEKLMGVAMNRVGKSAEFARGQAESLPFEDCSFDRVFCSFSYRDLRDQLKSLGEFYRVLKTGGKLVLLDIANYDSGPMRYTMSVHLHYVVPFLTRLIIPRKVRREWERNLYIDLWNTYHQFKTPAQIATDVRSVGFENVETRILSLGGAFLLVADKH